MMSAVPFGEGGAVGSEGVGPESLAPSSTRGHAHKRGMLCRGKKHWGGGPEPLNEFSCVHCHRCLMCQPSTIHCPENPR